MNIHRLALLALARLVTFDDQTGIPVILTALDAEPDTDLFADLCAAVRDQEQLRGGFITWAEVDPEITEPMPEQAAEHIAASRVEDALDELAEPARFPIFATPSAFRQVDTVNPTGGVL